MRFTPISTFRRASLRGDRKWFSEGAIRFFGSRLPAMGYVSEDGRVGTFVSSEQDAIGGAWGGQRRYTVRRMTFEDGLVDDVGEFMQYADREAATRAAMQYVREYDAGQERADAPAPVE